MFGDGFILPRFSIVVVVDESSAGDPLFDVDGGVSKVVEHSGESEGFMQNGLILSISKGRGKARGRLFLNGANFCHSRGRIVSFHTR